MKFAFPQHPLESLGRPDLSRPGATRLGGPLFARQDGQDQQPNGQITGHETRPPHFSGRLEANQTKSQGRDDCVG